MATAEVAYPVAEVIEAMETTIPKAEASELPVRSRSVKLSVPIDATTTPVATHEVTTTTYPKRKVLRRDSLERREALLKGREGSRQRRRWENGRIWSFYD